MIPYGISEIDEILAGFSDYAADAKGYADDILQCIASGRIPSQNSISLFNSEITLLQAKYDEMCTLARDVLTQEEYPEPDSSIHQFAEAMVNKRKQQAQALLDASEYVLKQFVSLQAAAPEFAEALRPYQEKALALLTDLSIDNVQEISASDIFRASEDFLHILALPETDRLLPIEQIGQYYPLRVQLGLMGNKYCSAAVSAPPQDAEQKEVQPVEEPVPHLSSVLQAEQEPVSDADSDFHAESVLSDPVCPADEGAVVSEATDEAAPADAVEGGNTAEPSDAAEVEDAAKPEDASGDMAEITDTESCPDAVYTVCTPVKKAPPSAKSFKQDVVKKYPREARTLLPFLTNFGALTPQQAFELGVITDCLKDTEASCTAVTQCLDKLADEKGVLARFCILNHSDTAYCLTGYSSGCLQKDIVRAVFTLPIGKPPFVSDDTIPCNVLDYTIECNSMLIQYLKAAKGTLNKKDFYDVCFSIQYRSDACHVPVYFEGQKYPCVLYHPLSTQAHYENLLVMREQDAEPLPACDRLFVLNGDKLEARFGFDEPEESRPAATAPDHFGVQDESPAEIPSQSVPAMEYETPPQPTPADAVDVPSEVPSEETLSAQQREEDLVADLPEPEASPLEGAAAYGAELCKSGIVTLEQLFHEVVLLIAEGRHAEAIALLDTIKEAPNAPKEYANFYHAYVMSANLPVLRPEWLKNTNDTLLQLQEQLPTRDEGMNILLYAALAVSALQVVLFPAMSYDYDLYTTAVFYLTPELKQSFPQEYSIIRDVLDMLCRDFKDVSFKLDGLGFSNQILDNFAIGHNQEARMRSILKKARELGPAPKSTIGITGLETVLQTMVGPASTLGKYLRYVAENDQSRAPEIREFVMNTFCAPDSSSCTILPEKLGAFIDKNWNEIRRSDKSVKVRQLNNDSPARNTCIKALNDRIEVIMDWLSLLTAETDPVFLQHKEQFEYILDTLKFQFNRLLEITAASSENSIYIRAGKRIIQESLSSILRRFDRIPNPSPRDFFYPLICKPYAYIGLDGSPVIIPQLYHLHAAEPWIGILRSICSEPETPERILAGIDDFNNTLWYRNYGREQLLRGDSCVDRTNTLNGPTGPKSAANQKTDMFKGKVRLARAYGKVQESLLVTFFGILDQVYTFFCGTSDKSFRGIYDFALYGLFLEQMEANLSSAIKLSAQELRKRIDALKSTPKYAGAEIFENIEQALQDENFVRVETYINRLEGGELSLPVAELTENSEQDFLQMFLRDEDAYYRICSRKSGDPFYRWAIPELQRTPSLTHWTSINEQKRARDWTENWIRGTDSLDTRRYVSNFLKMLGFNVREVRPKLFTRTSASCEVYPVSVIRTSSGLKDYRHPIYKYGTDLPETINVVCLFGCKGVSTLITVMTNELQLNGPTIVMMDGSLSAIDRRKVSAKFKSDTNCQSPFLLIDRVLMLFLASLDDGERLCAMLRCTLPFTFETLYTNGSGPVPDEMFIGRAVELRELTDPNGPALVYGGRQLGKTALLNRACKILNKPDHHEFAFCCTEVKDHGSDVFLADMNDHLQRLKLIPTGYPSIPALCSGLRQMYSESRFARLTIFVDEVDSLFDEYKQDNYKAIRPFVNLMDSTNRHVRFVFTGTHNVAATEAAIKGNSNLIHLGQPLCIEPLSTDDASRLIRRPMSYLGFDIGQPQLELIINNTNSYPGLIHMFCSSLVRSVCENFKDYYSEMDPHMLPYRITDEQMKDVFQKRDIRKEIGIRVMATIELNERYNIVASFLAYMIYEQQNIAGNYLYGFSAQEIIDCNTRDLNVPLISALPEADLETLLDEMVKIGILWKNPQTKQFRFKQMDFLEYIGNYEKVLKRLCGE